MSDHITAMLRVATERTAEGQEADYYFFVLVKPNRFRLDGAPSAPIYDVNSDTYTIRLRYRSTSAAPDVPMNTDMWNSGWEDGCFTGNGTVSILFLSTIDGSEETDTVEIKRGGGGGGEPKNAPNLTLRLIKPKCNCTFVAFVKCLLSRIFG